MKSVLVSGTSAAAAPFALLALLAASLLPIALISPVNHDETQYMAASYIAASGLQPFRDFLYLQTPYQVWLFEPLFAPGSGMGFVLARLATGLIGAATLGLVYAALRAGGAARGIAAGCSVLAYLCHAFVFSTTLVRNDALPALLLALALWLAIRELACGRSRWPIWLATGIALGIAVGTKISYAAPAAAFLAFPVAALVVRRMSLQDAAVIFASLVGGLTLALAPLLAFRGLGPVAFDYGTFGYHADAPLAWYAANGLEERLTLAAKLRDVLLTLARGPALVALGIYGWWRARSWLAREPQDPAMILLDILVLAGLAATAAPTPTWRQYAMPLLPPLFVALGLAWQGRNDAGRTTGRVAIGLLALFGLVGLGQPLFQLFEAVAGREATPLSIRREGAQLAALMRARALAGPVATLSPEVPMGGGLPLDPAFATGPFAYRTGDTLDAAKRAAIRAVSPKTLAAHLDSTRPAAIVTGYENFDHVDKTGLEQPFESWARGVGYERIQSAHGDAVFWLRRGR